METLGIILVVYAIVAAIRALKETYRMPANDQETEAYTQEWKHGGFEARQGQYQHYEWVWYRFKRRFWKYIMRPIDRKMDN